ncbi:hypothetical protein T265_07441 [Opisthorchis viverrini]|uniref:Uncharacterized protein n=1 Tax=Opisthorchis viverrini TaxID=6198 RepID=A0A074ZH82_OPIVI|nr:hypothetical protein T265_07441 [Opisthorchis viverrini]KER25052.1 hypothetical protein T265_07441 [Opisthorchis viverrini]
MLPKRSTRIRILPRCPSLDGGSQDREVIVKLWIFRLHPFGACCNTTRRRHEGWDTARMHKSRQGKLRGRGQFAPQTFRSVNSRSNHLVHVTPKKHEGWDTARMHKSRQGKLRGRGQFAPQTFRSVNSRSNHLVHVTPKSSQYCNVVTDFNGQTLPKTNTSCISIYLCPHILFLSPIDPTCSGAHRIN